MHKFNVLISLAPILNFNVESLEEIKEIIKKCPTSYVCILNDKNIEIHYGKAFEVLGEVEIDCLCSNNKEEK